MPSRDSKGRFTSDSDLSISIPSLTGLYKILIFAILILPWYVIISNRNISSILFGYMIGNTTTCPKCEECPKWEDRNCECPIDCTKCPVDCSQCKKKGPT